MSDLQIDLKEEAKAPITKQRAIEALERDLGAEFLAALADPLTVELLLNADGFWWQERQGETLKKRGTIRAAAALGVIKTVAGFHGKVVTAKSPGLEAEFPIDNSRFAAQIPPVVAAPVFSIRKKAVKVLTLAQYVESGVMTSDQSAALQDAISSHKNILVSGGTGSGKTTLINTLIGAMVKHDPSERYVIIEDTGEIQCTAENAVQYHTSATVSMETLLRWTLRMRPDRILVGETRGKEALDLLMAWNTGHEGGAATIHSNSPSDALDRLLMLISMNPNAPRAIEPLIAKAVHFIVQIERLPNGEGRRITGMLAVKGYENGRYITEEL